MSRKNIGLYVLKICFVILWGLSIFLNGWNRSVVRSAVSATGVAYFVWSSICTRGLKKTLYLILTLALVALLTAVVLYKVSVLSGGEIALSYLIGIILIDALIYLKVAHILDREEE